MPHPIILAGTIMRQQLSILISYKLGLIMGESGLGKINWYLNLEPFVLK